MKSLSNTSGSYGSLQGADSQSDPRTFSLAATIAVLVVSAVVAFKMAGPETRASLLSQLAVAAQSVSAQTVSVSAPVPRADAPTHTSLAIGEH